MALTEAATKKVGPLPAWGWGAIAVGGFVAWRMFGGSGNNPTTQAGVPSVGAAGGDTSGGGGGGGSGGVDTSGLQAAVDAIATKIGNITIPGTGGGGGGGGSDAGGGTPLPPVNTIPGTNIALPSILQPAASGVPNTPQTWGAPISLAAPSQDTYVLAQQYYYAITHPGLPGYGGVAPDRSTLFTQDASVMTEQLRQLLTTVESSIGTTQHPGYEGAGSGSMTDAFGNPYPQVPSSIFEWAGMYREQLTPTSFIGQQYAQQGYPLNIDPNLPSANQSPSVVIAKLQADIVTVQGYINNLKAVPASQRTAAQNASLATYNDRLASFKQELTTQQKISQAINAGVVFNVADALASGGPPTVNNATPTQTAGTPAPSTTAAPVDYSKAISTVQGYISNLSAVKNPTTAQKTELAMYQARLADYQSR